MILLMRKIDKQGKNYENYYRERLVKSVRKVKYFVDNYYFGKDFNKDEKLLEKSVQDHFSLAGILRGLDFYPEDYVPLNRYLICMYQALGNAFYPKEFWDVPLEDFLEKNKNVAPFDDFLQEDCLQLSFNFKN